MIPFIITLLIFYSGNFILEDFIKAYSGSGHILPLFSKNLTNNTAYTLFSYEHIIDIINEYLLITPIAFFIFIHVIFKRKMIMTFISLERNAFLLIGSAFYFIFCFIFNMEIGVSRDWDLFSASAIPITLVSVLFIIKIFENRLKAISIIIIGCCILHTVPWIIVNSNENYSLKRFLRLTESKIWSPFAKSYAFDELRAFYDEKQDYNSALEYAINASNQLNSERFRINLATAYNNSAKSLAKEMNFPEAELHFINAHKQNPVDMNILTNLGLFYFNLFDYDKALIYFIKAYNLQPENALILRNIIILNYLSGKYDDAGKYAIQTSNLSMDERIKEDILILKNAIRKKKQKENTLAIDRAIKNFNLSKNEKLGASLSKEYSNLAIQMVNNNNYADAEQYFIKAFEHNPQDFIVVKDLGFFYYNKNDYNKALTYYRKALDIQPENANVLRNIAMLYYLIENYAEAEKNLDRAIELNTDESINDDLLNFKRQLTKRKTLHN